MKREKKVQRIDLGRASVETRGPVGAARESIGKQFAGIYRD